MGNISLVSCVWVHGVLCEKGFCVFASQAQTVWPIILKLVMGLEEHRTCNKAYFSCVWVHRELHETWGKVSVFLLSMPKPFGKLPFWIWNASFISYSLPSCHRQLSSRQPARKPNKVDIGNYLRLTLKCVQGKRRISMNSNVLYYVKNKHVWLSNVCWCVGFLCMDIFGYELCYSCQIVFVFQYVDINY